MCEKVYLVCTLSILVRVRVRVRNYSVCMWREEGEEYVSLLYMYQVSTLFYYHPHIHTLSHTHSTHPLTHPHTHTPHTPTDTHPHTQTHIHSKEAQRIKALNSSPERTSHQSSFSRILNAASAFGESRPCTNFVSLNHMIKLC